MASFMILLLCVISIGMFHFQKWWTLFNHFWKVFTPTQFHLANLLKGCGLQEGHFEKRCDIKDSGQEMAVMAR